MAALVPYSLESNSPKSRHCIPLSLKRTLVLSATSVVTSTSRNPSGHMAPGSIPPEWPANSAIGGADGVGLADRRSSRNWRRGRKKGKNCKDLRGLLQPQHCNAEYHKDSESSGNEEEPRQEDK